MNRIPVALIAILFALAGLAGCFGGSKELSAAFACTPLNADKTQYKCDAGKSSGDGVTFSWDMGDHTAPLPGKVVTHTYQYPNGKYTVTLTVKDASGKTEKTTEKVTVGNGVNHAPTLCLSTDKRLALPNETVTFDSTASKDDEGDPLYWHWNFNAELSTDQLNAMKNLGRQAYGFDPDCPAPSGNTTAGNQTGGNGTLSSPSGYDPAAELQKAVQRFIDRHTLHGGGSSGPPEIANPSFNGTVSDTSPIQLMAFPAPATYYVHVRLEDVKGDASEGFLRIMVQDNVPPAVNTTKFEGDLKSSALPVPVPGTVDTSRAHPFSQPYAGTVMIGLNFKKDPDSSPLDAAVALYVCGKSIPDGDCPAQSPAARRLESGASGRILQYPVRADNTGEFKVMVVNKGQSNVLYVVELTQTYDLNPWILNESGLDASHH